MAAASCASASHLSSSPASGDPVAHCRHPHPGAQGEHDRRAVAVTNAHRPGPRTRRRRTPPSPPAGSCRRPAAPPGCSTRPTAPGWLELVVAQHACAVAELGRELGGPLVLEVEGGALHARARPRPHRRARRAVDETDGQANGALACCHRPLDDEANTEGASDVAWVLESGRDGTDDLQVTEVQEPLDERLDHRRAGEPRALVVDHVEVHDDQAGTQRPWPRARRS